MALTVHLDTSAVSAFFRADVAASFILGRAPRLSLSPVVVGELKAGFGLGERSRSNLERLQRLLASPRVVVPPLDDAVTENYGRLWRELKLAGTPIPTNDLWIAAALLRTDDVLFSFDRHFDRLPGLRVVRDRPSFESWLGRGLGP